MSDQAVPATEPIAAAEPAPAAPAAPAEPAAGAAPWAQDLATLFPDETVRTQVDTYLRANVQPHVTRLEQELAPAKQLWNDLQGDESVDTFISAATQLYGEDAAKAIAKVFEELTAEPEPTPTDPPVAVLTPEQQAALDWAQDQRVEREYATELDRVKGLDPSIDGPRKEAWFANFVVGSEGDFDEALRRWQASGLGAMTETAAPPPPAAAVPPATLGDEGQAGPTPPTAEHYASFDEAFEAAMVDVRAARAAPPAVGQV